MRVFICGSRDYPKLWDVEVFVAKLAQKYPDAIVLSGGARGVDRRAEQEAAERGLTVVSIRPYEYEEGFSWEVVVVGGSKAQELWGHMAWPDSPPIFPTFAKAAFGRNDILAELCDVAVAFWDGESNGTRHAIGAAGKKVKAVYTP